VRVVVVGAGIAGLTAAWALRGHDVVVLEAEAQPGGRMRTCMVGGRPMETGAQFLSTGYGVVPTLAKELGLPLRRVHPGTAVVVDGRVHRFRSDRPESQLTGGLLPWQAAPRALTGLARTAAAASGRRTWELTDWTHLDDETADRWSRRTLGYAVTDRLMAPTVHGFYFQSLGGSSAALAAAVASFGVRPGSALTVDGGLGRFTQAMADRLDVRLGQPVTAVTRTGRTAVVTTPDAEIEADRVVLALPGAAALRVVTDPAPEEREVMTTAYSRGLLVGLPVARRLHPDELGGAYGVLVHPEEESPVAAVAVAARAHPRAAADGDLLTVMFADEHAGALVHAPDEDVVASAAAALVGIDPRLEPLLATRPADAAVVRHAQAMPAVSPGHARAVDRYRRRHAVDDPLVLAGDYLGFPWTDSAASTGLWAARAALGGWSLTCGSAARSS
jgi:oxygen-dependent protoporphyrinogen oxidase